MLIQILTHTPLFVWAILAFLIFRGVYAMRDREMGFNKLFILPVVMLVLSLSDIAGKFGLGGAAMAAWAAGAAFSGLLVWKFTAGRIAPGSAHGNVLVRGSWKPLALMMGVFFTKYVTAVTLAILPNVRQEILFAVAISALFGILNGIFLGRLAKDVTTYQQAQGMLGAAV